MNASQMFRTLLKTPQILIPIEHLFLLSHMRANTSLFGHLLGSHPDISGYYELHIGYYSWKSLLREKLIYFSEHKYDSPKIMFDKILHNDHEIENSILTHKHCRFILSLREPEQSIKSIVSMYIKKGAKHEDVEAAIKKAKLAKKMNERVSIPIK